MAAARPLPAAGTTRRGSSVRRSRATEHGRPERAPYVQRRATSRRCQPSSDAGVTRNDGRLDHGNSRLAAARKTRSVIVSCGRLIWRRSTESSCRSTTISSSLKSCERERRKRSCSTQRTKRYKSDQDMNHSSESAGPAHDSTGRHDGLRSETELTHPTPRISEVSLVLRAGAVACIAPRTASSRFRASKRAEPSVQAPRRARPRANVRRYFGPALHVDFGSVALASLRLTSGRLGREHGRAG
jgi:hypothetical protein